MANPRFKWTKEENLDRFLSLLKQHKELSFRDLKQKLNVSEPTLSDYIKALEQDNQIEHFFKHKDRRWRYYRIKPASQEIVNSRISKFEVINYILSMPNPVFAQNPKSTDQKIIAGFTYDPTYNDKQLKAMLEKAVSAIPLRALPKPLPNQKTAIVIMISGDKT